MSIFQKFLFLAVFALPTSFANGSCSKILSFARVDSVEVDQAIKYSLDDFPESNNWTGIPNQGFGTWAANTANELIKYMETDSIDLKIALDWVAKKRADFQKNLPASQKSGWREDLAGSWRVVDNEDLGEDEDDTAMKTTLGSSNFGQLNIGAAQIMNLAVTENFAPFTSVVDFLNDAVLKYTSHDEIRFRRALEAHLHRKDGQQIYMTRDLSTIVDATPIQCAETCLFRDGIGNIHIIFTPDLLRDKKVFHYPFINGDEGEITTIEFPRLRYGEPILYIGHPKGTVSGKVLKDIIARFNKLLEIPREETAKREFALIMYGYFNAMPFYRGSAAIGRVLFPALSVLLWRQKLQLPADIDLLAMVMDANTFARRFAEGRL